MAKKFTLVVVLLAVVALCLTLAACGKSAKTTTEGATTTTTTTPNGTTPATGSDTTPTTGSDTTPTTGSDTTPTSTSDTTAPITGENLPPVEAEIWAMIEEEEAEWMQRHNTYDYKEREFPDGVTRNSFYFSIKAEGGQFPVAANPTDHPNPEIAGTWAIAHTKPVAVYIKDINNDADYTKYEITHWYTGRWFEMIAAVDGFEPVDGAQYDIFMFCMSGSAETGATYPDTLHYLWDFGEPYTYQAPYVAPETSKNLTTEQLVEIKGDKLALLPHGGLSINAEGKLFYSLKMDNGPFGHEAITDAEGNKIDVYGIEKTSFKELYINGKKYDIVAGSYTTMDWYKLEFYIQGFTPVAGQTYEVLFTLNSEDKTGVYCKNSEGYFVHIAEYTYNG